MIEKPGWHIASLAFVCALAAHAQTPTAQTETTESQLTAADASNMGHLERLSRVPMVTSTLKTFKGTSRGNFCAFNVGLAQGETAIYAIAQSPARANSDGTCEADYEVGEPPKELLDWIHEEDSESRFSKTAVSPKALDSNTVSSTVGPPPPIYTTSSGQLATWYQDPVGIVVNKVQISLSWEWATNYPPPAAHAVIWNGGTYLPTWYTPSGWALSKSVWSSGAPVGSFALTSANAIFTNNTFPACSSAVTATHADSLIGDPHGFLSGLHALTLAGPLCSYLLSDHFLLTRTK